MMNLRRRIALVAIMLVLAIGGAIAQPGGGRGPGRGEGGGMNGGGPRPEAKFDDCLATLDLTQDQIAAIRQIKARMENAMVAHREAMQEFQEALRAARAAGNRERAAAIMEQMNAAAERFAAMQRAGHEAILEVLTDAQKEAFADCMKPNGRGEGRGRGGDNDRRGEGRQDCWQQLDLSERQLAAIRTLRETWMQEHQDEMDAIREKHRELRQLRRSDDATEEEIAALRAEIRTMMEALKAAQEEHRQDVLDVLTEEQKQQLIDCRERRGNPGRGGVINNGRAVPELK